MLVFFDVVARWCRAREKRKRKVVGGAVFQNVVPSQRLPWFRVSDRQKELLLAFVKEHPQIATLSCPLGPSFTREDRDDMWQELVALLNEVPARNTTAQWQIRWRNERYYSQQGLAKLREQQR